MEIKKQQMLWLTANEGKNASKRQYHVYYREDVECLVDSCHQAKIIFGDAGMGRRYSASFLRTLRRSENRHRQPNEME